jgi:hypothetical protein
VQVLVQVQVQVQVQDSHTQEDKNSYFRLASLH